MLLIYSAPAVARHGEESRADGKSEISMVGCGSKGPLNELAGDGVSSSPVRTAVVSRKVREVKRFDAWGFSMSVVANGRGIGRP